ncbi:MAG: hypothetical protein JGK30_25955 [Microcoleus sp. PH2017_40_RAT_O_B]|uniref:hypothetical protein n=1 Tax=unclassified Microcoleus TaxID=2642155 RepID=UPI001D3862B8|nr:MULTISPECIES: hypothetical protein [unclassified Microcoleus]MCC3575242.1 hypothetical protein [Microcoleus sp. PH2017_34_RAT_O_A]MCC3612820.1 hypothetical protein [Microcoleus sp. PH2017_40_RAT_O_B]
MAISNDGRELLDKMFSLVQTPEARAASAGMKTTNVAGFPLFLTYGRWGGAEANQSGNVKAFLFLPYLQTSPMPLTKFDNTTSIESPLNMVASGVPNPYNCKCSIVPSLNTSFLIEGEFYWFLLSAKPAAMNMGGTVTPYWDASLKAAGENLNEVAKDFFAQFALTKGHWKRMKKTTPTYEEEESHEDTGSSN